MELNPIEDSCRMQWCQLLCLWDLCEIAFERTACIALWLHNLTVLDENVIELRRNSSRALKSNRISKTFLSATHHVSMYFLFESLHSGHPSAFSGSLSRGPFKYSGRQTFENQCVDSFLTVGESNLPTSRRRTIFRHCHVAGFDTLKTWRGISELSVPERQAQIRSDEEWKVVTIPLRATTEIEDIISVLPRLSKVVILSNIHRNTFSRIWMRLYDL